MFSFKQRTVSLFFVALSILLGSSNKGFSSEDQPAFDTIATDIKAAVKALEYPDEVGQDIVKMVKDWKCVEWKQKLSQAKQDLEAKTITADQAAQVEEEVAKELFEVIGKEIRNKMDSDNIFDLAKVLHQKKASSGGYAQVFSILGKSLGLSINFINAYEPPEDSLPSMKRHLNCCIIFSNGKMSMVDFLCGSLSSPFNVKEEFTKNGIYLEARNKSLLGIHSKIQIWDGNGILAAIHYVRGMETVNSEKYTEALPHFTKAIELNPRYVDALSNRGMTYSHLGNHAAALIDTAKAIELDPHSAEAYCCRGYANVSAKKLTEALSDFNKSIELSPNEAVFYFGRALVFRILEEYTEALADCDKAIELKPKVAGQFEGRGAVYHRMGKYTEAIADYDKAIEISPKDAKLYFKRGLSFVNIGNTNKAKRDLLKAVELDSSLKKQVQEISDHYSLNISP